MDLLLPQMGPLFWLLFLISFVVLPFLALFNITQSTFRDSKAKFRWMVLVILMPVAGSILYFIFGRKERIPVA